MGKSQKAFLIPEDLARVIEAHQKATGATFTRVMIAALLQHFFQDPEGPNPVWMEDAMGIELGEHGVGDMVEVRKGIETADAQAAKRWLEQNEAPEDYCNMVFKIAKRRWSDWNKIAQMPGDDPIQKIIEYRSQLRKGGPGR
jgi:hypothetical protein